LFANSRQTKSKRLNLTLMRKPQMDFSYPRVTNLLRPRRKFQP